MLTLAMVMLRHHPISGQALTNQLTSTPSILTTSRRRSITVEIVHDNKISEYDQEIPQSHTADQPTAP